MGRSGEVDGWRWNRPRTASSRMGCRAFLHFVASDSSMVVASRLKEFLNAFCFAVVRDIRSVKRFRSCL